MDLAPKQATVIRDGVERTIAASQLRVGDTVVSTWASITADGVVTQGMTSVDESAISGEYPCCQTASVIPLLLRLSINRG